MNDQFSNELDPFIVAQNHFDSWRGRCLDHFSRIERKVGDALEEASRLGKVGKFQYLASQRLDDLDKLFDSEELSPKQVAAFQNVMNLFRFVEPKRAFLAHGEIRILQDRQRVCYANFDLTRYSSGKAIHENWFISKPDSEEFERKLAEAFQKLSSQLGQMRKRWEA